MHSYLRNKWRRRNAGFAGSLQIVIFNLKSAQSKNISDTDERSKNTSVLLLSDKKLEVSTDKKKDQPKERKTTKRLFFATISACRNKIVGVYQISKLKEFPSSPVPAATNASYASVMFWDLADLLSFYIFLLSFIIQSVFFIVVKTKDVFEIVILILYCIEL